MAFGHPRGGELPQPLKDEAARDLAARRETIVRAGGIWVKAAPATIPVELDANPDSLEYRTAIARNYWAKGHHPRSKRARLACSVDQERRVGKECRSRWSPYH